MTSAETVLIQQHSIDEFLKLFSGTTSVYMGVSPQSLSSLSTYFREDSNLVTFKKLQTVFLKLGVKAVYNLAVFNEIALA